MKKIILVLSVILLASCGSVMDKDYSSDSYLLDIKEIKDTKAISEDDISIMSAHILKSIMQQKSLDGKSYTMILDEAKKIEAEKK